MGIEVRDKILRQSWHRYNNARVRRGLDPVDYEEYLEIREDFSDRSDQWVRSYDTRALRRLPCVIYEKARSTQEEVREKWAAENVPDGWMSVHELGRRHDLTDEEFRYFRRVLEYEDSPVCAVFEDVNGMTTYYYDPKWLADLLHPDRLTESGLDKYYVDTGI